MDHSNRAVLGTARLELRPLRPEDAAAVIDGVGRLTVSRYLSIVPHPYGTKHFAAFFPGAMPGRFWAIDDGRGLVGVISLAPGLGFWIAPDRQGRGYVTEAARAVLAAHFADPLARPGRLAISRTTGPRPGCIASLASEPRRSNRSFAGLWNRRARSSGKAWPGRPGAPACRLRHRHRLSLWP